MAILCDFDLYPDGITPIKVTSAYWRILEVNTLKSESLVRVGIFRDSASSSSIGLFVFLFLLTLIQVIIMNKPITILSNWHPV